MAHATSCAERLAAVETKLAALTERHDKAIAALRSLQAEFRSMVDELRRTLEGAR